MTHSATTIFLVLLALAAGFYLGADPVAHEMVAQAWQKVDAIFIEFGARVAHAFQEMNQKFEQLSANDSGTSSTETTQPDSTGTKAPNPSSSLDLDKLLSSLSDIWIQLTARFKAAIS